MFCVFAFAFVVVVVVVVCVHHDYYCLLFVSVLCWCKLLYVVCSCVVCVAV